jgi:hypothetical protein
LAQEYQDQMKFRRLQYLNQVLIKVIDRFEEHFPNCRVVKSDGSDEDFSEGEEEVSPSKNLAKLRRSSSMSEIAKKLEIEEGDVHRFRSMVNKRDLIGGEAELTSEQLLQAILKVDKDVVERDVWDQQGLRQALRQSIDVRSPDVSPMAERIDPLDIGGKGFNVEGPLLMTKERRDSDSHSI